MDEANVTLKGNGMYATVLLSTHDTEVPHTIHPAPVVWIIADGCTAQDLSVTYVQLPSDLTIAVGTNPIQYDAMIAVGWSEVIGAQTRITGTRIERVFVDYGMVQGIAVGRTDNTVIKHCRVANVKGTGIWCYYAQRLQILANQIEALIDAGICVAANGPDIYGPDDYACDVTISTNTIQNTCVGIQCAGALGGVIDGNVIDETWGQGIAVMAYFVSGHKRPRNIVVSNNVLRNIFGGFDPAGILHSQTAHCSATGDNGGIETGPGTQPSNDGLELVSDTAGDTRNVTITGTTHGSTTVVTETVTLTGTTAVATVKTDWGIITSAVANSTHATATITLREASGNAAVTWIRAGEVNADNPALNVTIMGNKIAIIPPAAPSGNCIGLYLKGSNITASDNDITGLAGNGHGIIVGKVADGSYGYARNVKVHDNTVDGGYYGVGIFGATDVDVHHNTLTNGTVKGLYFGYAARANAEKNTVCDLTGANAYTIATGTKDSVIEGNFIASLAGDTFTVVHSGTPATTAVYVAPIDGVYAYLNADNSADNADDYFTTANGERVLVKDNNGSNAGYAVYFDEDGATGSRLLINNTITGTDLFVRTSEGRVVKFTHSAGAAGAGNAALYFDDDGADATLRLNATLPGTTTITTSKTCANTGWI
jgi:hypothetical protein